MTNIVHSSMQQYNGDVLSSKVYSSEPTTRSDGTSIAAGDTAFSNGTSSTRNFGVYGDGLYVFNGTNWDYSVQASDISLLPNYLASTQISIASDTIQITKPYHSVETEGAASSDTLSSISMTAFPLGAEAVLTLAASRTVTVVNSSQLQTDTGADLTWSDVKKRLIVKKTSSGVNVYLSVSSAGTTPHIYIDTGSSISTIQSKINTAASIGATVVFPAGTFDFGSSNLDITSGFLNIEGQGDNTILQRTADSVRAMIRVRNGAVANIKNLKFNSTATISSNGLAGAVSFENGSGGRFFNNYVAEKLYGGAGCDSAKNVKINNNFFKGLGGVAVFITGSSENIVVESNDIDGKNIADTLVSLGGIWINPTGGTCNKVIISNNYGKWFTDSGIKVADNSDNVVIHGNVLQAITVGATTRAGIIVQGQSGTRGLNTIISGNQIDGFDYGIWGILSDQLNISSNIIRNSRATCIQISDCLRPSIISNSLRGNSGNGGAHCLYLLGNATNSITDFVISGNIITDYVNMGISIQPTGSNYVRRGVISGNSVLGNGSTSTYGLYVYADADAANITGNVFLNNATANLSNNSGTSTAANNITS